MPDNPTPNVPNQDDEHVLDVGASKAFFPLLAAHLKGGQAAANKPNVPATFLVHLVIHQGQPSILTVEQVQE